MVLYLSFPVVIIDEVLKFVTVCACVDFLRAWAHRFSSNYRSYRPSSSVRYPYLHLCYRVANVLLSRTPCKTQDRMIDQVLAQYPVSTAKSLEIP